MRRLCFLLLVLYALLTFLVLLRAWLGLAFLLWPVLVLPLLAVIFSFLHSGLQLGWPRAWLFFTLTIVISLGMESLGVATGWIYGPYHYTDRLGPLFLGLVPYSIPLTWYMMLYPANRIAQTNLPVAWSSGWRWLAVAAWVGLWMLAWDLALDPLMAARGHWIWETPGAYFGVPWQNFGGWWLTAFLIMLCHQGLADRISAKPIAPQPAFDRLAYLAYGLIAFGSLADAWLAGLQAPALASLVAMLFLMAVSWLFSSRYWKSGVA